MAINYFTFNGVSSLTKGLYVSGSGTFNAPEKDYEVVSVPGRSGDLLIDNERFKNVDLVYPAIIFENYLASTSNIRNWLLSADGYCRLEDTYHTDEFRLAYFVGPIDIETLLLQAGECEVTFKCKPQRYLKTGETIYTPYDTEESLTTTPFYINNPTSFPSRPIVYITRTDASEDTIFTVANTRLKISENCSYQFVAFDSERRSVYGYANESDMRSNIDGVSVSTFASVSNPDFPVLNPGSNTAGTTCENIDKVSYRGRWWIV